MIPDFRALPAWSAECAIRLYIEPNHARSVAGKTSSLPKDATKRSVSPGEFQLERQLQHRLPTKRAKCQWQLKAEDEKRLKGPAVAGSPAHEIPGWSRAWP